MLKKLLLALGLLLLLAIVGTASILIKPQLLRGAIAEGAERFAGLNIEIARLESHRSPLRLEIHGLQISNPEWPEPTLLRLDALSLQLIASPFSDGAFWSLDSRGLQINLASNDSGEINWLPRQLRDRKAPQEATPASTIQLPGDFSFQQIRLRDTRLALRTPDDKHYQLTLPDIRGQRRDAGNGELNLQLDYQQQAFTLNGHVALFDPAAGILDYRLDVQHQDAQLRSEGRLVLSPNLAGSRIALDLTLQRLQNLAALAEVDAPPLPPSLLRGELQITPDYEVTALAVQVGKNTVNGQLQLSPDFNTLSASLNSPSLDIDALSAAFSAGDSERNATTPAANEGSAEDEMNWQWLAERKITIAVAVETLKASGWQLEKLQSRVVADGDITLSLSIAELLEAATSRRISELDGQLTLTPLAKKTLGSDAKLALTLRQQALKLSADGVVNLNGLAGSELNIRSSAPRSAEIWSLALLPWREAGALSLDAQLRSEAQQYTLRSAARLGDQQAAIDLNYRPAKGAQRANLQGSIELNNASLAFMETEASSSEAPASRSKQKNRKVLSQQPFALESLAQLNAALDITLSNIDTGYLKINTARLKPTLTGGVLQLKESRVYADGGEAFVSLKLDASRDTARLDSEIKVDGSDYGKLGLEKAAGIRQGQGKIRIALSGAGASPAALAGSLNGGIDMKITGLQAKGNALNLIGSDVLSETIDKLNPFSEKRQNTEIECLAVHFKGKSGRFTSKDGIALETETSKIIGTGYVDLAEEELRFGISPIARKGVGVNVGAAASLVRLGGTFARPRVEADPGGMFTSGLSTGAAIYTGGLSLVAQGLMKRALYAGSACDGALDEIPAAEALPDELLQPQPPLNPDGSPALTPEPGNSTSPSAAS